MTQLIDGLESTGQCFFAFVNNAGEVEENTPDHNNRVVAGSALVKLGLPSRDFDEKLTHSFHLTSLPPAIENPTPPPGHVLAHVRAVLRCVSQLLTRGHWT